MLGTAIEVSNALGGFPITDHDIVRQIHNATSEAIVGILYLPAVAADFLCNHVGHTNGPGGWGSGNLIFHMILGVLT